MMVRDKNTSWNESLTTIRFAMNTTVCVTTGQSASYLMFGRELRTLDDVQNDLRDCENCIPLITPYRKKITNMWIKARELHDQHQDMNKTYADRSKRHQVFNKGDRVWVVTHTLSSSLKQVTTTTTTQSEMDLT